MLSSRGAARHRSSSSRRCALALAVAVTGILAAARPASAEVTVFETKKRWDFKVDLYGWVQPRFTYQEADERPQIDLHPNPAFTVQRARLGARAWLGKWARTQIEVDFAREVSNPIDAFVVFSPLHEPIASVNLQIGQFRVPFSRQNLLQSRNLQLPDLAYFVNSRFIVDRDIGAMLWGDLFDRRGYWAVGVFNGNEPGRGQTQNSDRYFLFAGRLEISPLGAPPRFEGDMRPLEEQRRPVVTLGGSAMRNRFEDKHFLRSYVGADLGAWWYGASIYGEVYYHVDEPLITSGPNATTMVKQLGWNVQAGYFLPLPWVREHVEIVGRIQRIDPNIGVTQPANDNGARDLDQSNPTWGYMGFVLGANVFLNHDHDFKLQASYEIRNETKRCLEGQSGDGCTGYIDNNLFVVQATAGF